MKQLWEQINAKLGAMSRRERMLVFVTLLVLLASLADTFVLTPLFNKQKMVREQLQQQQEKINTVQSQIAAIMQASSPDASSPQRRQLSRIRQDIAEGSAFLQSSRDKLVQPENMAAHLRQLLNRNIQLQLVALQTLPVTPLLEQPVETGAEQAGVEKKAIAGGTQEQQVFKHGVQLTLRGNYLDLMQYVSALEKLPQQMFWAKAQMSVVKYPSVELTLTLYTLSLDKTWLQI